MSDSERTSDPSALQGEGTANGNGRDGGAKILHLPTRGLRPRRHRYGGGDDDDPHGARSGSASCA